MEEHITHINPEQSLHDQYVKALALGLVIKLCSYIRLMYYKSNIFVRHCVPALT